MIMTQSAAYNQSSRLYVWGSNSNSELGLSDDLVEEHKDIYKKGKNEAYLAKPIC